MTLRTESIASDTRSPAISRALVAVRTGVPGMVKRVLLR
jgi:hypothetical protein